MLACEGGGDPIDEVVTLRECLKKDPTGAQCGCAMKADGGGISLYDVTDPTKVSVVLTGSCGGFVKECLAQV